ncbi:MAG: hypothetical protein AAGG68_28250 [Bacteroidota bacterium]
MKLRTTHNSIRIRVRKSELVSLQHERRIEESIGFPSGVIFRFVVEISEKAEYLQATFEDQSIVLSIPDRAAIQWMNSNQVGIENQIQIPDNEKLTLLIEKDFPCLDRENEDKSDTFWELAAEQPESC